MPTSDHRNSHIASVGNALAELDLERLPAHQKKVSDDWFAIFNPGVPRVLDIDLLHTLPHESVVCCVRFSHDGKYVATGCNRSAQIFDVVTGQKVCVLQDESVEAVGDLYIRSVCFSPDGKYLATGAEDKLIRVCSKFDLINSTITNCYYRCGTLPQIRLGTLLQVMSKISILLTLPRMAEPLRQEAVIVLSVFGTSKVDSISCP
jgi:glucose repression regulatory protein TUP1